MASVAEAPRRKLSFLEDQEYRRQRDEAEAAAAASEGPYKPTTMDWSIFAYFCVNCFLLCGPFLNSNAAIKIWKSSDTFTSECVARGDENLLWCPEQAESAKIALLLFQSSAAAANMMGGVLVDTFSAAMCMLISHLLFAGGSYFLQSPGTRGIFAACALQGAAGELLINSVLPICGLFGEKQNIMLVILTFFADLSVLVLPLVYQFLAPRSAIATTHENFYQALHNVYFYIAMAAGIIGTFILPIDDDGNLVGSSGSLVTSMASATTIPSSINVKPSGSLSSSHSRIGRAHSGEFTFPISSEELLPIAADAEGKGRKPKSLWNLRLSRQMRTPQFFIALILFSLSVLRISFYLNNNQQLLEAVGDDGTMTSNFMWLLGLSAFCTPISWHINDNWPTVPCLFLFTGVSLSINLFASVNNLQVQWLTILLFVFSRASTFSTILTYLAGCFGFQKFPIMTVIVGMLGGIFNFSNLLIDQYIEQHLQGDYMTVNLWMIGVGVLCVGCAVLHAMYPTLNEDPEENLQEIHVIPTKADLIDRGISEDDISEDAPSSMYSAAEQKDREAEPLVDVRQRI